MFFFNIYLADRRADLFNYRVASFQQAVSNKKFVGCTWTQWISQKIALPTSRFLKEEYFEEKG